MKTEVEEKSKCKTMLSDIVENSRQLFISPILRFTIISIVINFTFHIGYYGLMMWFPELFNRFDEYHRDQPGVVASICQVTDYVVNKGSHSIENVCSDKIGSSVFLESLITVASAIPANIIAVLGMDRLGRKFFLGAHLNRNNHDQESTILNYRYFVRFSFCSVQHFLIGTVLGLPVFCLQQVP